VEVFTQDGFSKTLRTPGDFFGEGALLHPQRIRSASIRCLTPVHAIEISREYFEKYVAADKGMDLDLRATDNSRKRQRAKMFLQLQKNMKEREYTRGSYLFQAGEDGKELFILEEGKVDISAQSHTVFTIEPGSICGEYSLLYGKPRNVTAQCVSDTCKTHVLRSRDFYALLESHPNLRQTLQDICLRREFQKALCVSKKMAFPQNVQDLRAAYDSVTSKSTGGLELEDLRQMLHDLDPTYSEQDVRDLLRALDLDNSGNVTWEEFKRLFDMAYQKDQ
jgi:CRP-like cAMP-binding protein